MPVYYTICPAPVPVVKGTVFNEILTLMRRFCTNKVEILTETAKKHVDAPMIDELPLALECKLVSYDEETELLLGEVVNVSVDERALDENGKLAVEKLHVITFDYANHGYYVLGEKVASAFEDGKKFK